MHTEPVFWEHEGNKAVRLGKYKLVMAWDKKNPDKWELFDMEKDRTEMDDLSAEMPGKVFEMKAMWEQWSATHFVEPWEKIREIVHE